MRGKPEKSLSEQVRDKVEKPKIKTKEYDGNFKTVISTGSTLLDLAISGGQIRGGGMPGGILVEIFGPSGAGKTVMLAEIGGAIQRQSGSIMFFDPEARLNKQFAQIFGLKIKSKDYKQPDTVPEVFQAVRKWEPENPKVINGIFADSLAALSTSMEMDNNDGDKMGMRRAKEFSEELRKTCRILAANNYLMVCSNQVRVNMDAGAYGQKYTTPGGVSIGFYSSLRLRCSNPEKIKQKVKVAGKEVTQVIGVTTELEVSKSSIWKPYHKCKVHILFDYGIDDIRANLQYIKDFTKNTTYTCCGESLGISMEEAIQKVESQGLISDLKNEVIDLWEKIERKFEIERKPKER